MQGAVAGEDLALALHWPLLLLAAVLVLVALVVLVRRPPLVMVTEAADRISGRYAAKRRAGGT